MSDALRALPLACPIDGLALDTHGRTFACARGHAYDVSRRGYVNLLPVQFKPSRDPGDDAAMVAARARVLESGLFDPLVDAVAERVTRCLASPHRPFLGVAGEGTRTNERTADAARAPLVVDAGCGEGHHTARLAAALRADAPTDGVLVLGTDISVHAVKAAARRRERVGWAVANNTHLPVVAGAADVVTSLFGFEAWTPWAALQVPGQHVVVAHAGPRHLIELRERVYATVRVHEPSAADAAIAAGYALEDERRVAFAARDVPPERLADVLAMTPHGHRAPWKASGAGARDVHALDTDVLSVDVVLRSYRRA